MGYPQDHIVGDVAARNQNVRVLGRGQTFHRIIVRNDQ